MTPARRFRNLSDRRWAFISAVLENGGRGRAAAIQAGYSSGSASITATKLFASDAVLAVLASAIEANPNSKSHQDLKRRLLLPSRPRAARLRFQMLLNNERPLVVRGKAVISDTGEEQLRDHVARYADDFGANSRCEKSDQAENPSNPKTIPAKAPV